MASIYSETLKLKNVVMNAMEKAKSTIPVTINYKNSEKNLPTSCQYSSELAYCISVCVGDISRDKNKNSRLTSLRKIARILQGDEEFASVESILIVEKELDPTSSKEGSSFTSLPHPEVLPSLPEKGKWWLSSETRIDGNDDIWKSFEPGS